jgi:Icc-related predicted phosphoesterase
MNCSIYDTLASLYKHEMRNIVFSHGPPINTVADLAATKTPSGNLYVGSADIRQFLCDYKVESLFCGHIH